MVAGSCIGHKNDCYFNFTIPSTTAWDAMASNYYDSATARARAGILMGYVGSQVGMDYGATASSAKTKDLVGVFNSWGIHCNYRSYNSDDALESIRQRMPVIIDGFRNRNNFLGIVTYSGGHAWIIDGSRLSTITTTTTYKWVYTGIPGGKNDPYERDIEGNIVGEDPVTVTRTLYEYINYFRCNWGWSGHSSDHLYYHKDDAFTGNDKEYKYDNKMIIGFSVN